MVSTPVTKRQLKFAVDKENILETNFFKEPLEQLGR